MVTLAGEVALSRRRHCCRACGGEVVPLDALLGLKPRMQHTTGVRERALWLVIELSENLLELDERLNEADPLIEEAMELARATSIGPLAAKVDQAA